MSQVYTTDEHRTGGRVSSTPLNILANMMQPPGTTALLPAVSKSVETQFAQQRLPQQHFQQQPYEQQQHQLQLQQQAQVQQQDEQQGRLPVHQCWKLQVTGIPEQGTATRVETQVRMTLRLFNPMNFECPWHCVRLPEHLLNMNRKKKLIEYCEGFPEEETLELEAVVLDSEHCRVHACNSCIAREKKFHSKKYLNEAHHSPSDPLTEADRDRIIVFSNRRFLDLTVGEVTLNVRFTCYCTHSNEDKGFRIEFRLKDMHGNLVASVIAPPVMVLDDHRLRRLKSHGKRTEGFSVEPALISYLAPNAVERPYHSHTTTAVFSSTPSTSSSTSSSSTSIASITANAAALSHHMSPPVSASSGPTVIHRVIPATGSVKGGQEVSILGTNLFAASQVYFGTVPAASFRKFGPNTIIAVTPPTGFPGECVVHFGDLQYNGSNLFTYNLNSETELLEMAISIVGKRLQMNNHPSRIAADIVATAQPDFSLKNLYERPLSAPLASYQSNSSESRSSSTPLPSTSHMMSSQTGSGEYPNLSLHFGTLTD